MIGRLRAHRPALIAAVLLALPFAGCQGGDGVVTGAFTINADVARGTFVLFSFSEGGLLHDGGTLVETTDPSSFEGWDIAATRWVLATNSGDSQGANSMSRGALLALEGTTDDWASLPEYDGVCSDFAAAGSTSNTGGLGCSSRSPTVDSGYISDTLDDPDGAGPFPQVSFNPSLAFWFQYDFTDHEVLPFGNVYVVETHDGRCAKVQFTDYYDADGGGGQVAFDWEYLTP